MKKCKYGKLKSPSKGRRCKQKQVSKRKTKAPRRVKRSGRGRRVAKAGLGLVGIAAIGAVGAYAYFASKGA